MQHQFLVQSKSIQNAYPALEATSTLQQHANKYPQIQQPGLRRFSQLGAGNVWHNPNKHQKLIS